MARKSKGARRVVVAHMPGSVFRRLRIEACQRGIDISDLCRLIVAYHVGREVTFPAKAHPIDPDTEWQASRVDPDRPKSITARLPVDLYEALRDHNVTLHGDPAAESHTVVMGAALGIAIADHLRLPPPEPLRPLVVPSYQKELLVSA